MEKFYIEDKKFFYDIKSLNRTIEKLEVRSSPNSYNISIFKESPSKVIKKLLKAMKNPVLLIDSKVFQIYFKTTNFKSFDLAASAIPN